MAQKPPGSRVIRWHWAPPDVSPEHRGISSLLLVGMAVAVFKQPNIIGEAIATNVGGGTRLRVTFSRLPKGKHGFHIHKAGDLRVRGGAPGCAGACEHFHLGATCDHGGAPSYRKTRRRHTGDLGNIEQKGTRVMRRTYFLSGVKPSDLWGRTLIIHEDEDDLGLGPHADSKTTGHSGKRIGCAIFGRLGCAPPKAQRGGTRRRRQRGGVALEVLYGDKVVSGHPLTAEETAKTPTVKIINPQNIVNTTQSTPPSFILVLHDSVDGGEPFYIHWVVSNIQYKNAFTVGSGDFPYYGPAPPAGDERKHVYTFQLYLQPSSVVSHYRAHGPFNFQEFKTNYGLQEPIHEVSFTLGNGANE